MTPLPVAIQDIMKNSILLVSASLWVFSCLIGKSCPSAIYPFNTDDSHDGATLAKNSNKLDLPRDLSQPIIARFAREVEGEDPTESQSSKFHLLIIIIPVVMGIVVIIIIVLVVCNMRRRSERGTCISNEWLVWCGLLKRSNPSSVRDPGYDRSAIAFDAPSVRGGVRYEPGQNAMSPTRDESTVGLLTKIHHLQTPQQVAKRENHTGACPSEWSPNTLPNTPDTSKSSLPTDDEWSPHSRTPATEHHSGTPKFTYPNPKGGHDRSITVEQTRAPYRAMYPTLENISEKEDTGDGRDIGKAGGGMDELSPRSGSDDDVFKPGIDGVSVTCSEDLGPGRKRKGAYASEEGANEDTVTRVNQPPILVNNLTHGSDSMGSRHVEEDEPEMKRLVPNKPNYTRPKVSHGDLSNQEWKREVPNSAPPGDTHREIRARNVYVIVRGNAQVDFNSDVENVQVGNKKTHVNINYLPQDVTDSRHDARAFNRSSNERQTR